MKTCKVCSNNIRANEVVCDGICGEPFHTACLKRSLSAPQVDQSTCAECQSIKPCHVLRLMNDIAENISNDRALLYDRITKSFSSSLQILSDDLNGINNKTDLLLETVRDFNKTVDIISNKFHGLSQSIYGVTHVLEDLHSKLAVSSLSPLNSDGCTQLSVLEDIRRFFRQVKGDFGSWSLTVARTSERLNSVLSDLCPRTDAPSVTGMNRERIAGNLTLHNMDTPAGVPEPCSIGDTVIVGSASFNTSICGAAAPLNDPVGNSCASPDDGATVPCPAPNPDVSSPHHNLGPTSSAAASVHRTSVASNACRKTPALAGFSLKAAQQPKVYFISRLDPSTSVENVLNYVNAKGNTDSSLPIYCERLKSRHPNRMFASFKLTVPPSLFNLISAADFWPNDIVAHEFVHRPRFHNDPRRIAVPLSSDVPSNAPQKN